MRLKGWLLSAVLTGICLTGCKMSSGHAYPDDPLFVSKKPIEAKAETAPPVKVAYAEPVAPISPLALVSRPRPPLVDPLEDPSKQLPTSARHATRAVSSETVAP
jgi:hypothetical protein